jgi:hypothetical protein
MAQDSQYIFDYLNDIWSLLPEQDQIRFGETWKAYEQTYGDIYMQQFQVDMANTIQWLPLYNVKRWLQHTFDATTAVAGGPAGFPYSYQLQEADIVSIPLLQNTIHDNLVTAELVQDTDYVVAFGTAVISFAVSPYVSCGLPLASRDGTVVSVTSTTITVLYEDSSDGSFTIPSNSTAVVAVGDDVTSATPLVSGPYMWAKDTLCNFETPYNNYGYLMGIYAPNTAQYLKSVKGLWYAFWNGPSPENIRRSLFLLFGLPSASYAGTVTAVNAFDITLTYQDTSTETFAIPNGLEVAVAVGQVVTQFQPLVTGIEVLDKINSPGFVAQYVGRPNIQTFLTQYASKGPGPDTDETRALILLEQNTFLPQIDVNCFISSSISLANVQTFLNSIKPKSRTYFPQIVVATLEEEFSLLDTGFRNNYNDTWPNGQPCLGLAVALDAQPDVDWNNNTAGDQSQWDDAETNPLTGMTLDDSVMCFGDYVVLKVYEFSTTGVPGSGTLIDTYTIEG